MQDNNGLLELLGEESQLLAEEQLGKLCRDYAELVKQENEALATLEELLKLYNCRSKKSMAAFAEKFPLLIRLRSSLHQLLTKDSDILGALENRLHG
jgi:hypothetical protein